MQETEDQTTVTDEEEEEAFESYISSPGYIGPPTYQANVTVIPFKACHQHHHVIEPGRYLVNCNSPGKPEWHLITPMRGGSRPSQQEMRSLEKLKGSCQVTRSDGTKILDQECHFSTSYDSGWAKWEFDLTGDDGGVDIDVTVSTTSLVTSRVVSFWVGHIPPKMSKDKFFEHLHSHKSGELNLDDVRGRELLRTNQPVPPLLPLPPLTIDIWDQVMVHLDQADCCNLSLVCYGFYHHSFSYLRSITLTFQKMPVITTLKFLLLKCPRLQTLSVFYRGQNFLGRWLKLLPKDIKDLFLTGFSNIQKPKYISIFKNVQTLRVDFPISSSWIHRLPLTSLMCKFQDDGKSDSGLLPSSLTSLITLSTSGYSLNHLTNLQALTVSNISCISKFSVHSLKDLTLTEVNDPWTPESLKFLKNATCLQSLKLPGTSHFYDAKLFNSLPYTLTKLSVLSVSYQVLDAVPDAAQFPRSLKSLYWCLLPTTGPMTSITGLPSQLHTLILDVSAAYSTFRDTSLASLSGLTSLHTLCIRSWSSLTSLDGMPPNLSCFIALGCQGLFSPDVAATITKQARQGMPMIILPDIDLPTFLKNADINF